MWVYPRVAIAPFHASAPHVLEKPLEIGHQVATPWSTPLQPSPARSGGTHHLMRTCGFTMIYHRTWNPRAGIILYACRRRFSRMRFQGWKCVWIKICHQWTLWFSPILGLDFLFLRVPKFDLYPYYGSLLRLWELKEALVSILGADFGCGNLTISQLLGPISMNIPWRRTNMNQQWWYSL